jgi:hypothetical protein
MLSHMSALVAFGLNDAVWYVAAAAGAAVMLGLIATFRRLGRWGLGRIKSAYFEWFEEAIDEHVEPKFQAIREDTAARAEEVKEDLRIHTQEEGDVVRAVVNEAVAPIKAALNERAEADRRLEERLAEHMEHDDRVMERVGAELKSGQDALIRALTRGQDRTLEQDG